MKDFRISAREKDRLLKERQMILDGNDDAMLEEVRIINEQMQEQKHMLINRMEVRIFGFLSNEFLVLLYILIFIVV